MKMIIKSFRVIFTTLYLFKFVTGEFSCPRNNQNQPIDGTYRDPNNCNIYYHCINGTSSIQSCPPGYHFQIKTDSCKFIACVPQQTSDCQQKSTKFDTKQISNVVKKQISAEDVDECKPNKNETVQHFIDCRLYFHCYNGIAWPQRCPFGYFFSPKFKLKRCIYQFCVPFDEADCSIDGQWSSWSTWSNCTGDCGEIGTRRRTRECNNPPPINGGNYCDGDSNQTEACRADECQNPASFSVSLKNNQVLNVGKVKWTKIDVNNNLFNWESQSLNIKRSGFYFFSISGTVSKKNQFTFSHQIGYTSGVSTKKMNLTERTITREYGMLMSPIYKSYIQQESQAGDFVIGSENGKETSWSGFFYDTDTYLFATIDRPIYSQGNIPFNIYQINGFNRLSNSEFKSLSTGFFYISFAIGIPPYSYALVNLISNGQKFTDVYLQHRIATTFVISTNIIMNSTGEKPSFALRSLSRLHSSKLHETYMSVFKLNESKPMFSIKKNKRIFDFQYFTKITFFNENIIDNFDCWDSTKNAYKIPLTGNYYVTFTMPTIVDSRNNTKIELRVNNESRLRAVTDCSYMVSLTMPLSNSAVFHFKQNDRLELFVKGSVQCCINQGTFNIFYID